MPWRDILYGVLLFPVVVVLGAIANPGFLLVAGVPSGAVAGRRTGGFLGGFAFGAVTGFLVALLTAAGGTYAILRNPPATHLPGMGLSVLYLWAIVLGLESTVGGAFAGYLAET